MNVKVQVYEVGGGLQQPRLLGEFIRDYAEALCKPNVYSIAFTPGAQRVITGPYLGKEERR